MDKIRNLLFLVFTLLALPSPAFAMHIMEGYLRPSYAIFWAILCVPVLIISYVVIKRKVYGNPRLFTLLALCGAFAFVLSALKIPSLTGSCSHPTGVGLGAILFGPWVMALISTIILLFQALLLAHGGLTTLGANVFSMGIVGPMVAWGAWQLGRKMNFPKAPVVFIAAFLGNIITYITTSLQLALAYPDQGSIVAALIKFMGIFALTQLPLAVCEGLITVVMFNVLEKYQGTELKILAGEV